MFLNAVHSSLGLRVWSNISVGIDFIKEPIAIKDPLRKSKNQGTYLLQKVLPKGYEKLIFVLTAGQSTTDQLLS